MSEIHHHRRQNKQNKWVERDGSRDQGALLQKNGLKSSFQRHKVLRAAIRIGHGDI